jgi:signal-transduction protein with cAMP-binding, CBS, and nucleotidyltransferase domain
MEKQFGGGEDYKNKFEFLQQMSFFKSLGEYDFLDLTTKSQIKEYRQGSTTHKCGGTVDMIGCVIIGKVKLHYPTDKEGAKGKKITVSISEGDWLGLQEYLWKQDYRSSGEVSSIIAMVVWIPIDIFESKFNTMANYSLINRLNDLIEVKKNLFERSLHCRRSKETEG